MATFYYHKDAETHLCNKLLACTEESYEKLKEKGKITDNRKRILFAVQRFRLLTEEMLLILTKMNKDALETDLTALMEYGLLIKQFYECRDGEFTVRTESFYAASPDLPQEAVNPDKKHYFVWKKDLSIAQAMSILSFNQFHIALKDTVPAKALQAQTNYVVRKAKVDGRYRLKNKKFMQGYSHMFAVSVRDFAEQNQEIEERLMLVREAYLYGTEKMPWFVLICENKVQCAYLNRRLRANPETRELMVYYILDTDIVYDENPLHFLQTYKFANNNLEIRSETFRVENWY